MGNLGPGSITMQYYYSMGTQFSFWVCNKAVMYSQLYVKFMYIVYKSIYGLIKYCNIKKTTLNNVIQGLFLTE